MALGGSCHRGEWGDQRSYGGLHPSLPQIQDSHILLYFPDSGAGVLYFGVLVCVSVSGGARWIGGRSYRRGGGMGPRGRLCDRDVDYDCLCPKGSLRWPVAQEFAGIGAIRWGWRRLILRPKTGPNCVATS